ncbi:erythroblast NAD(P)(+)--arginine ADP-ribosyltransferase-like isoform X1 [Hemibagrus wyckioides]|uniref:erythroblast NAD(P)(+)--arginine ADP-ribosyltransferase-like isoform X1 n=1 Tax=Hemibagrus wyckioides TaxID=337641 RepID=UPI00266D9E45|nr:erythroblast NAD(P)(+)--arginine ADP-ribosyltransferase-like isoform X1 [Hemibagrus wyckioides]XP_058261703.1 erythroblast NAD(P)(+)--arginine ADP-ribosyltransferase-like isoform X1 [Hemibagrus wyckioides]
MRKAVFINTTAIITIIINNIAVYCTWNDDNVYELDTALDSVDDQYIGCVNESYNLIKTKILQEEFETNQEFENAWNKYSNITDDFTRIIKVYTTHNQLYKQFNDAVGSGRINYRTQFKYKAFHFLLTRAVQMHKVQKCVDVFRRTDVYFKSNDSNPVMRFDRFASTSLRNNIIDFGEISCFKINTCFGANISAISEFPDEEEVLVPPFEKFNITDITTIQNEMNCSVLYTLQSVGNFSNMNCELLKKKARGTVRRGR